MAASPPRVDPALAARAYARSGAARWDVAIDAFQSALDAGAAKAWSAGATDAAAIERHVSALHLEDLALAIACAAGVDDAWDHFVREYRPVLYRAADAIDPTGGARDLADTLIADLFGLRERGGIRQSLLRYFHGRSSLATWLRAVLAQRHVDRLRAARRMAPLGDDEARELVATGREAAPDPERGKLVGAMREALAAVIADLPARDRLRLACYYAQDMTLAAIGRLLREHEATVSRHLTRTRQEIRDRVERHLREREAFDRGAIAECVRAAIDDARSIDLDALIGAVAAPGGKNLDEDRSR